MKKEDIKKVFDGESVARVPVGFWHHFIPHSEMGQIRRYPLSGLSM